MADTEILRQIIAEIKFRRGLRQAEIAKALGVKATYLSDMINGRVPFSDAIHARLSELFTDCMSSSKLVASGDSNTQISGNGNRLGDSVALSRAFDEIVSQRQILERTISIIEKKDDQIDRLISILETKSSQS
jgi:transcriptional regulator with XRE-family HTH domain